MDDDDERMPLFSVAFELTFETRPTASPEAKMTELATAVERALRDVFPDTMIRRLENMNIEVWT